MIDERDLERGCIVLADGTILSNSHCGYSDRNLWCMIRDNDKSLQDLFLKFTDPAKTQEIIDRYSRPHSVRYRGFTEFLLIKKNEDSVDIRLTWPEGGEHSIEEFEG